MKDIAELLQPFIRDLATAGLVVRPLPECGLFSAVNLVRALKMLVLPLPGKPIMLISIVASLT